jgi:hypothetical protein
MRFRTISRLHSILGVAKAIAIISGATFGAVLRADAEALSLRFGGDTAELVKQMQGASWWVVLLSAIAIPVLDAGRKGIGAPAVWRVVRDVLDQFRGLLFPDAGEDHLHEHRVTLFKYSRWRWCLRRWPWSGWLTPVERSGHTTQRTNIAFLAPDDADRVEGVAGMTWYRRQVVHVKDLPDLSEDQSDEAIKDYARRSWIPEKLVRERLPRARSLVGIPVEVKNEIWGIIVVDSRRAQIRQSEVKKHYKLVARFLGKTLEGL